MSTSAPLTTVPAAPTSVAAPTSRLAVAALAAAAGLSAIALTDAVTHGLTGSYSVFSDESGVSVLWALSGFVHAAAYLLGAAVLVARGRDVDGGSRARGILRWVLVAGLVSLGVSFVVITVAGVVTGSVWVPPAAVGSVVGVSFALVMLGPAVLGLTLLRRPGWRVAAVTMAASLPLLVLTVLLGVLGSDFAHPAYAEVAAALGVALVGLAPRRAEPVA